MKLDSHHDQQLLENVAFLEGVGLSREAIARRLGLTKDTLDKKIERAKRAASHCEGKEV